MRALDVLFLAWLALPLTAAPPHALVRMPLAFEANRGQAGAHFDFIGRAGQSSVLLRPGAAVLTSGGSQIELCIGTPAARGEPAGSRTGRAAFFHGRDPRRWMRDVPTFAAVRYRRVFPGVDTLWYGRDGQLEFDFLVSPGADTRNIVLKVRGAERIRADGDGGLLLGRNGREFRLAKPVAYQEVDGRRREVGVAWLRWSGAAFGFDVAAYDRSRPLVIDPVLLFSTYLGLGNSVARAIAVDPAGNIYVAGGTDSGALGAGSLSTSPRGGPDAFLLKLDPTGSTLLYAAYIGGSSYDDANGVAVDAAGNAYVAGITRSADFPAVKAWQGSAGGSGDGFVAKLNPQGNQLVFSTYIGGRATDAAVAVAADAAGASYVAGNTWSPDFPLYRPFRTRVPDSQGDAFACKFAADGAVVYSAAIGGSGGDNAYGAAIDSGGNLFVTGIARSPDFPVARAYRELGGSEDAFLTKLSADGSELLYSSFLGFDGPDEGFGVAVDGAGDAYVAGFSIRPDPFVNRPAECGGAHAFVAKVRPDGSDPLYWRCLNGTNTAGARAIAVDAAGNAYLAGSTDSSDFPLVNPVQREIGSRVLFRTADRGASWTPLTGGLPNQNVRAIQIDPGPGMFYAALANGIFRSPDGENWQRSAAGLEYNSPFGTLKLEYISSLALDAASPGTLYAAGDGRLFKSTTGAESWTLLQENVGAVFATDPQRAGVVYVQLMGGIGKSTDGGRTFARIGEGLPTATPVSALAVSPVNSAVLYAATPGAGGFRSGDGGATFSAMPGLPRNVTAWAVDDVTGATVYAGTSEGVYLSTDGGSSWRKSSAGLADSVNVLAVEPGNPSTVYAGTRSYGVYRSTDGGGTWASASSGITASRIWALTIDPREPSRVYAGGVAANDAFVARLDPSGSDLLFSTFLGGMRDEAGLAIAAGVDGVVYVAGQTGSDDFPTASALRADFTGTIDGFVAKLATGGRVACTPAASMAADEAIAPDSIATLWGQGLAPRLVSATALPLPLELAGASLKVTDSAGVERPAPLYFVSPGQVNFLVPAGTATGRARLIAVRDGVVVGTGAVEVSPVAPGLFAANANGRGVPAATGIRLAGGGELLFVPLFECTAGPGSCVPVPIDLGPAEEQIILTLYGTGIRGRSALAAVRATIGGLEAEVQYAGPQADVGVDQVNLKLPRALAGRGAVDLLLTVDGKAANAVTIAVK